MRSSFCKCLPSFRLARRRRTGTVSGCHYRAAVTDADGAEAESAPQGSVCLCRPHAGLPIPAICPSVRTYFPLPWTLCVLTGRAQAPIAGSVWERQLQKAWRVDLSFPDGLPSRLPTAAYAALQRTRTGALLFCVVCRPLSCPPK